MNEKTGAEGQEGNGKDEGAKGPSQEDFNTLTSNVDKLTEIMQGVQVGFGELKDGLNKPPTDPKPAPKELDFSQMETMSRGEFATSIMETMMDRMKREIIEPLQGQLGDVTEKSDADRVKTMVKDAGDNHKDFWDWKDEMADRVRQNPYLTPEEAYQLSRANDGKKAGELDEKYKEPTKDEGEEGKGKKFGGMKPGGGQTAPNQKMSKKDAAEAAWEEAFSGGPV